MGTDNGMALHIFNLTDAAKLNNNEPIGDSTEAPETDAVTEAVTQAPETEAETKAPETEAPATEAPSVADTDAPETEPAKSGCGASVGMSAAALFMAVAAFVALKKKD